MQQFLPYLMIGAGAFFGIAAIVREWFKGRALLVRAERGDPEPLDWKAALPTLLEKRREDDE